MTATISLALPDSWRTLRLDDTRQRERAVTTYVEHQFRGDDAAPLLKAELRETLLRQAADAAAGGGILIALSEMKIGRLPVPASLTVYGVSAEGIPGSTLDRVRDRVLEESSADQRRRQSVATTEVPAGRLLRHVRRAKAAESGHGGELEVVLADYWLEDASDGSLALMCFSSPLVVWQEQMVTLFDAIAENAVRSPAA